MITALVSSDKFKNNWGDSNSNKQTKNQVVTSNTAKAAGANAGRQIYKEKQIYDQAKKTAERAAKLHESAAVRVSKPDFPKAGLKGGLIGGAIEVATRYIVNEYKEGAERGGVVGGVLKTVMLH
ncbi:hypothetical protein [Paenibacillus faecalis]|uniref:hypothetical protein n=1 Tax=Paenibacillus faecalis TaxID=2079532 RepID=UPI000D0FC411|nr:hypothetical protein [Paenibacillus faecalis]